MFFAAVFVVLILLYIFDTTLFQNQSGAMLVFVTLFYVFLTYELVRATQDSKLIPFIDVRFIVISKLDAAFLDRYGGIVRQTEKFRTLKAMDQTSFNKNVVFVKIENLGEANAVDTRLEVCFDRKNLGEVTCGSRKTIEFGTLKKGESAIDYLDEYQTPTQEDYFKVSKCTVEYKDINRKFTNDDPMENDFSKSAPFDLFNDDVLIHFTTEGS